MTDAPVSPVALVTGGSKGIGRAICVELARAGYEVIVNYHSDADGARETLGLIEAAGVGARAPASTSPKARPPAGPWKRSSPPTPRWRCSSTTPAASPTSCSS